MPLFQPKLRINRIRILILKLQLCKLKHENHAFSIVVLLFYVFLQSPFKYKIQIIFIPLLLAAVLCLISGVFKHLIL